VHSDLDALRVNRWSHFVHHAHCRHCTSDTPAAHCGRASGLLAAGQVAGALVAVSWWALLTHQLSLADVGRFSLVQQLGGLVSTGTDLGIPLALTKLACDEETLDRGAVLGAIVRRALIGLVAAVLLTVLWFTTKRASPYWLGVFWGLTVVVNPVTECYFALLRGRALLGVEAGWEILKNAAILGVGTLALGLQGRLFVVVVIYIAVYTLGAGAVPTLASRRLAFTTMADPRQRAALTLRSTAPLAAPSIVGNIYERVDMYFVGLLRGSVIAGVYGVAYKLYDFALYPAKALSATAIAAAGKGVLDDIAGVVRRLVLRVTLFTAPLALLIGFGASAAIRLYNGRRYLGAVGAVRILAVASIPTAVLLVVTPILVLHRRAFVLRWSLVGLVTNAALNAALIPPLGARGAAFAYLATETMLMVLFTAGLAPAHRVRRRPVPVGPQVAPATAAAAP